MSQLISFITSNVLFTKNHQSDKTEKGKMGTACRMHANVRSWYTSTSADEDWKVGWWVRGEEGTGGTRGKEKNKGEETRKVLILVEEEQVNMEKRENDWMNTEKLEKNRKRCRKLEK
jgi:hypothetical protein